MSMCRMRRIVQQLLLPLAGEPGFHRLDPGTRSIPLQRISNRVGKWTKCQTLRNRLVITNFEDAIVCVWDPQRELAPRLNAVFEETRFGDPDKARIAAADGLADVQHVAEREAIFRASRIEDADRPFLCGAHNPFSKIAGIDYAYAPLGSPRCEHIAPFRHTSHPIG